MNQLIPKRLESLWDRNFSDLLSNFPILPEGFNNMKQIRLDIKESEKSYTVSAEIPGVNKEDIDVQIDGNVLSIEAVTKQEKEEKEGDKVIHTERYYGKVSRSVRLGHEIDQKAAQASYKDGVLELVLPKKTEPAAGKRLTIK